MNRFLLVLVLTILLLSVNACNSVKASEAAQPPISDLKQEKVVRVLDRHDMLLERHTELLNGIEIKINTMSEDIKQMME